MSGAWRRPRPAAGRPPAAAGLCLVLATVPVAPVRAREIPCRRQAPAQTCSWSTAGGGRALPGAGHRAGGAGARARNPLPAPSAGPGLQLVDRRRRPDSTWCWPPCRWHRCARAKSPAGAERRPRPAAGRPPSAAGLCLVLATVPVAPVRAREIPCRRQAADPDLQLVDRRRRPGSTWCWPPCRRRRCARARNPLPASGADPDPQLVYAGVHRALPLSWSPRAIASLVDSHHLQHAPRNEQQHTSN